MIGSEAPFPLTLRFKSMLQSGVATRDLDVRWVSSLSWYFLNLFGLQSVFIFILGNDNAASQMAQQMQQMNPSGAGVCSSRDRTRISCLRARRRIWRSWNMSIHLRGLRRGFWGWRRLGGFNDIFLSHNSTRSYLVEHESDTGD